MKIHVIPSGVPGGVKHRGGFREEILRGAQNDRNSLLNAIGKSA
jgi:hypothetical protein